MRPSGRSTGPVAARGDVHHACHVAVAAVARPGQQAAALGVRVEVHVAEQRQSRHHDGRGGEAHAWARYPQRRSSTAGRGTRRRAASRSAAAASGSTAGGPGSSSCPRVPCGSPTRKSLSRPRPNGSPSSIQSAWMVSNWRQMSAWKQTKTRPRSTPSSSSDAGRQRRAVGAAAADDPVAVGEPAVEEADRVARVGAADVGAERALQAAGVVGVAEVVDPPRVARDGGVGRSGESASGVPSGQRPTIFAASWSAPPG